MDGATLAEPGPEVLDHVEALVRRSGTSFFWAMRLLPTEKRRAMYAVYAFCREVDDIADEPGHEAGKRLRLQEWREEIERLMSGRPIQPVARALLGPVARYGLKRQDFLALIDGMETDAADRLRLADEYALTVYCDQVACAVGRLSNRIFGLDGEVGVRLASALGEALQLTNILRDLDEDAARDRLYLPADLLARHGIGGLSLAETLADPRVHDACAELATRAAERFSQSALLIAACDSRAVRPARLMMHMYLGQFRNLHRRGWAPPRAPVGLSATEKIWIVARHGFV